MQSSNRWRAPRRTLGQLPADHSREALLSRLEVRSTNSLQDTAELRSGFAAGLVGGPWTASLPRYIWSRQGGLVREFRLVEPERARYVGYDLHPSEWPEGLT
jgi:hypothetical protein